MAHAVHLRNPFGLQLTFTTGGGISNIFGPIQAFDIPYLFRNDRVVNKVMEDQELMDMLADVVCLFGYEAELEFLFQATRRQQDDIRFN